MLVDVLRGRREIGVVIKRNGERCTDINESPELRGFHDEFAQVFRGPGKGVPYAVNVENVLGS